MKSNYRRFRRALALALVLGAVAAPVAAAKPVDAPPGYTTPTVTGSSQPTAVPPAGSDGFDWADAGIGAGAGFAVTMIGLGGALVLSSRRHRERSGEAVA
jgi:hypothetical protein